jgi:hypothetical protein
MYNLKYSPFFLQKQNGINNRNGETIGLQHVTAFWPHLVGRLLMILRVLHAHSWLTPCRAVQHCLVGGPTEDPGTTDAAHATRLASWVEQVSAAEAVWYWPDRQRKRTTKARAPSLVAAIFFGVSKWQYFQLKVYICVCMKCVCEMAW